MSVITDVILMAESGDVPGDELELMTIAIEVPPLLHVSESWPGGKAMQTEVWIAAYNYLDEAALLRGLREIPWTHPDEVFLCIKREHETCPSGDRLFGERWTEVIENAKRRAEG